VGELGFPFAEINLDDPGEVADQMADLLDLKKRYGFFYLAHYPNEGNPADAALLKKNFIPKMKKLIILSSELGIRKGTMHFWVDKRWAQPDLIAAKTELLAELVDHATQNQMILCLENLSSQVDSFLDVFNAVPGLRMTMDIGHGELLSAENTSFGFMAHLFEKIEHIHVHDNHGGTGVKDDLHLPLGEGVVDYPKILGTLRQKGYDSTITLEVSPKDMMRTRKEVARYIPSS
jgi:sugar phosphate isomerase/epimerase